MYMTNFAENALTDFRRSTALSLPGSWYIGLLSAASDSSLTELAGTGYARQAVARSLTAWAGTQAAGSVSTSTGTTHTTSNNGSIEFTDSAGADAAWGDANYYGFFDAASAGNLWFYIPIALPIEILMGDPVEIAAGEIRCILGASGGCSDYLANRLIDLIWRGQAYAWPATTYAAYGTTMPTNSTPGSEPAGGYARVAMASSSAVWSSTQGSNASTSTGSGGRSSNLSTVTFPVPSGAQADAVALQQFDAASAGNLLWWTPTRDAGGAVSPVAIPTSGIAPTISPGAYGITLR